MTQVLVLDSRHLALELHSILKDIDTARFRQDIALAVQQRLQLLEEQLTQLRERAAAMLPESDLPHRMQELSRVMREHMPHPHWPTQEEWQARWVEFRGHLMHAYEDFAHSLRGMSIHVPNVRPTNYARSLFHLLNASVAVAAITLLPSRLFLLLASLAFASTAWTMEIIRRIKPGANDVLMRLFGRIAHPHERNRVNSATWFATSLVVLACTVPLPIGLCAVIILGVADPVAALVGRRFGRIRLVNSRTLEGTLAFFLAGTIAAAGILLIFHPSLPMGHVLPIALFASFFGAMAELFSRRVDDNLSIPVSAGAGGLLALIMFSIAL